MNVRTTSALAALALAFAATAGASAQPYPRDPNGQAAGPYRVTPVPDDAFDDDRAEEAPPPYRQPPGPYADRPASPYPADPRAERLPRNEDRTVYGGRVYDPPAEAPIRDPYPSARPGPGPEPYPTARTAPAAPEPFPIGRVPDPYAQPGPPPVEAERAQPRPPADMRPQSGAGIAALPPEDQPESGDPRELPPQFRRQLVRYQTKEPAGTLIIDTQNTYLYLVRGDGSAIRYGIGVGREGFTWNGRERVSRMAEWPDWHPPAEMIERQPYLPRFMAGGPGNPLGARALYLGKTLYRIHGTNQPSTIGTFVSSGCIRLLNEDVEDLYQRVNVGTPVVVLPGKAQPPNEARSAPPAGEPRSAQR